MELRDPDLRLLPLVNEVNICLEELLGKKKVFFSSYTREISFLLIFELTPLKKTNQKKTSLATAGPGGDRSTSLVEQNFSGTPGGANGASYKTHQ